MAAVALTSRWIAAARAQESARPDRLFNDPFAEALARAEGLESAGPRAVRPPFLANPAVRDALIVQGIRAFGAPYLAIRTRLFDDLLLEAARTGGVGQIVILAAGMDTRAFRLPWPAGTRLYELDRPAVLEAKEAVLRAAGAQPAGERHTLGADLADPAWVPALTAAGYDAQAPSAWLIEGLLMYLEAPAVGALLRMAADLATPGSWLGADLPGAAFLTSPLLRPWRATFVAQDAPWHFGTDTPEALFAAAGWEATVRQPGEPGANYRRWPWPVVPRSVAGSPRFFLVTARRADVTHTGGAPATRPRRRSSSRAT